MLDTWIPQNTTSISNHKEQEIGAGEHAVKTCDSKVHFITRKQVTGDTSNHHLNKIITHQEKFHDNTISTMTRERGWKLKESIVVRSVLNVVKLTFLKGYIGAIHSLCFTFEGCFLAMAELADFVHVFDTKHDYAKWQEIDLFGELVGISFSPDSEALYLGVANHTYGSLLHFNWSHPDSYVNCLL